MCTYTHMLVYVQCTCTISSTKRAEGDRERYHTNSTEVVHNNRQSCNFFSAFLRLESHFDNEQQQNHIE